MKHDDSEAELIVQTLLDQAGAAMIAGDAAKFRACFKLPMIVDTFEGQTELGTEEDLSARFALLHAHYRAHRTTELVRNILSAVWFDTQTIHASHQCRVLSGTLLVQAPYTVFSIYRNTSQGWKVMFGQYAVGDSSEFNHALMAKRTPHINGDLL